MTSVLITGFGAYAEEAENPSGLIAARLDGEVIEGIRISGRVLAVGTELVGRQLADALADVRPDVLLVTGVTPTRAVPAVERVAINMRDFPIPDVEGRAPIDEPVIDAGPAAYFSTLPIKAILDRWRQADIPGFVSNSAGTYVCNQIFYLACHLTADTEVRAGLVHIPLPATAATAQTVLTIAQLEDAVRLAAIVAATHHGDDVLLGAGATS